MGRRWSIPGAVRKILLCATLSLTLASAYAAGADSRTFGSATCRVEKPAAWNGGSITWFGSCKAGYAYGLGALKHTVEGIPTEVFVGRVADGYLRTGVLVRDSSYIAGQWKDGSVVENKDDDQANRNTILSAFQEGAKAASATSRTMEKRSNKESSRYYSQLAKKLREQME